MYPTKKLVTLLLAALLFPAAGFAQKILRYSDHEPLGGMRTQFIKNVFFAAIDKESKGRLKIEDRWDSVVSTGYDALRTVGEGRVADMAIVVPEYSSKELPLHQIFKGYPSGPAGEQQVAFFRRVYGEIPEFSAELRRNNVVEIFLGTGYPVAFFSTQPMDSLKDLKGHSWRSASFWHQDFLRNSGAIPVSMPWGEGVFKAMQARTLDGLMVNVDSGYMLKVHEVAPHVLLSKDLWLGHLYVLAMNGNTWDGLAQEDKEAIQRAAETAYKALGPVMETSFDVMVADLKKAGVKTRTLVRKEIDDWTTATKYADVQAAWAKDKESNGLAGAAAVLKKVDAILGAAIK